MEESHTIDYLECPFCKRHFSPKELLNVFRDIPIDTSPECECECDCPACHRCFLARRCIWTFGYDGEEIESEPERRYIRQEVSDDETRNMV